MKVSVIIPVYNVEKYLSKCLDSVINQSYKNIEIICVNDFSPDKSSKILEEYALKDDRIKIVNHAQNGGLSAARNSGLDTAIGEYVYFLDSDDWIDFDYIEKMLLKALDNNADIILNTNIVDEYEDGKKKDFIWGTYDNKSRECKKLSREFAVNFTHCMACCHLYKKQFLIGNQLYFPVGYIHEDNYFNYITKINTDKTFVFYGPAYHYLQRCNSIMSYDKEKNNIPYMKITKLICDYNKDHPGLKKYKIIPASIQAFFPIDTNEKFMLTKYICQSILENYSYLDEIYNKFDLYCIKSLANAADYEMYSNLYPNGLKSAFILQVAKESKK